MKEVEQTSNANAQVFSAKLKALVQHELSAAFDKETKVYIDFLAVYKSLFSNYTAAFEALKKYKDALLFINETTKYYDKLYVELTNAFNEKEPLTLVNTFRSISEKSLHLFVEDSQIESGFLFDLLKHTQAEIEKRSTRLNRLEKRIKKAFRSNLKREASDSVNAIIYAIYEQSISTVLKSHETELLVYYKRFAELANTIWLEFNTNNAFINKLDKAEYDLESIDKEAFELNLKLEASSELAVILDNFNDFKNNLTSDIETRLKDFDNASLLKETNRVLSLSKIIKSKSKDFRPMEKHTLMWRNTRLVLMEDWLLYLEIFSLKYKIIQKFIAFKAAINQGFTVPLYEKLEKFNLEFDEINEELNQFAGPKSAKDFKNDLLNLKQALKKKFIDKSLPDLKKLLNNPILIAEIDAFESLAKECLADLSEKHLLIKNPDYLRPISSAEIDTISPLDLVSFEIKPDFITVFSTSKRALIAHTQNVLLRLETAPNIALYSFESAIKLYNEKKQWDEARQICSEGLLRSREKVAGTKSINDTFILKQTEDIKEAINRLSDSIVELTNNNSALQIKFRIVRAKALSHSQEVKKKIIAKILNFLPVLFENVKKFYAFIEASSQKIVKKFALEEAQSYITTDISHFLSTAQLSISKLPYIYQRLFSFEPLDNFDLYVERKQPMDELEMAYDSWKQEKFAPVVLIGERGSGKTTFLRKFIQSSALSEKIILIDFLSEYHTASANFKRIVESASAKKKHIDEKKIIIIDGLERLFESKINGFDLILDFFKLISDTQKEIFWIVSVHSISWNYFDKCILASNYFAYHIRLNNLSIEELIALIESRHNLSGYNVVYNDLAKKKSLLSSTNYDTEDPQIELRKNFFNQLNKSVQGNILQAYIYWLRSAHLTEDNWISIKTDNQLNFDFVRGIPQQKLQILKNILVQNGLTVESLALSFRISQSQSELELKQLLDDGIISQTDHVYYINSLIYKQLIVHLNNINLLH
ncbi:MAG: AAA family ATPase [Bacteroidales bacterium]|nr:AAA family ATPase [Bacteroidales bacterium]